MLLQTLFKKLRYLLKITTLYLYRISKLSLNLSIEFACGTGNCLGFF